MTKQYITFQRELTKEQCAALLCQDDRPGVLNLRTTVAVTLSVTLVVTLGGLWLNAQAGMSLLTTIIAALVILVCGPAAWMIEQLLRAKRRRYYTRLRANMLDKYMVVKDTSKQDTILAKFYHKNMDNLERVYLNHVVCLHDTYDQQHMRAANKQQARDEYDAFLVATEPMYQGLANEVDDEVKAEAHERLRNKAKACAAEFCDIEQKDTTKGKEVRRQREYKAELKRIADAEQRTAEAAVVRQRQAVRAAEAARITKEKSIKVVGDEAAAKYLRDEQVRVNSAKLRAVIDHRLS